MTISIMQASFTGGEWAPSLWSRLDLARAKTAASKMLNTYPHPHGPASNRGGTEFVGYAKHSDKIARGIPFQFSVVQTYELEFGDKYIRYIKDGGRILDSEVTISGATAADPVVITATGHGYSNGDWVYISGVVGMTEINNTYYVVANKTANDFEITDIDGNDIDGSAFTAYASGGTCEKVYETTSTYAEADLRKIKYTQSADVLYLTHPSYPPKKLTRTGHTAWTLSDISFASAATAPTSFARTAGSGTGSTYAVTVVTLDGIESLVSSTATGGADDTFGWDADANADYYNVYELVNGVYGYLGTAGSNSFVVSSTMTADTSDTPPSSYNPFSSADNYPGVCMFYEQRLLWARTNNKPQDIWGSVVGDFQNMNKSSPLKDSDAFNFTINSQQVNEIRWLIPMNALIIGTPGGEWKMNAGSNTDSITPTSVDIKPQSFWGVSDLPPLIVGTNILFVGGSEAVVRDLGYSLDIDGYTGNDLSIMSNHFFKGFTLVDWCYQQNPSSIVWAVRSDGALLGFTYYREHEVWGWHKHETDGFFESVNALSVDSGVNDVYVIVRRVLNGVTRRCIERMRDRLPIDEYGDASVKDAYFVDCGLTYDEPITISGATAADPVVITATGHGLLDGDYVDITRVQGMTEINEKRFMVSNKATNSFELTSEQGVDIDGTAYTPYVSGGEARKAVTTITGADHLEGETVKILADGSVVPDQVVTSGAIVLSNKASRVHFGKGYVSDLATLDLELVTDKGTMQDKERNIVSVVLELDKTRALWVGPSEDRLTEIPFRTDEPYGQPTELFTGEKSVSIEPGSGDSAKVFLRNVDPLPFTVMSIISRVTYGDV